MWVISDENKIRSPEGNHLILKKNHLMGMYYHHSNEINKILVFTTFLSVQWRGIHLHCIRNFIHIWKVWSDEKRYVHIIMTLLHTYVIIICIIYVYMYSYTYIYRERERERRENILRLPISSLSTSKIILGLGHVAPICYNSVISV